MLSTSASAIPWTRVLLSSPTSVETSSTWLPYRPFQVRNMRPSTNDSRNGFFEGRPLRGCFVMLYP
jgi:hypothetical protein